MYHSGSIRQSTVKEVIFGVVTIVTLRQYSVKFS